MLRLRPSELTLTPDDVEETFRRIAHRQALTAPTTVTYRASAHHGRPVLRHGPQRSTQDAITALGNIPILRPQPQQAIHTSVGEDIEDDPEPEAASSMNPIDNTDISPPTLDGQTTSALIAASSAPRAMQLPFRAGRDRRDSATQSTPDEPVAEATSTPPTDPSEHAKLGLSRVVSSNHAYEDSALPRSVPSTNSLVELRGAGRSSRTRSRTIDQNASHGPSPLQRTQRFTSPRQQEPPREPIKLQETSDESQPTLHLKGYFKDVNQSPVGISYHFRESELPVPHTEPRRRSGRRVTHARSLSSGNAPYYQLQVQRPDPSGSSTEDVFGTMPAPEPPTRRIDNSHSIPSQQDCSSSASHIYTTSAGGTQVDHVKARSRQVSSDTNASAAFSYYGSLPSESRHSSIGQSGQDQVSQFQYDGTAASRSISRGVHDANHSLDTRTTSEALLPPASTGSSIHSSLNLAASGQHGISPLPSMPYTRMQRVPSAPQSPTGFPSTTATSGHYLDAATAAAQDLRSPLDDYSEQYQRLMQAQHPRQAMPTQGTYPQHQMEGTGTLRSHQGPSSRPHDTARHPYAPRSMSVRQPQHHILRSTYRSSEHIPSSATQSSQSYGRSSQATRTNQRSSENVPVSSTSNDGRATRNSQVQTQRAAFERLQGAVQAMQAVNARGAEVPPSRFSMPQTSPRDMSNRPRGQAPHQFASRYPPRRRDDEMSSSPPALFDQIQLSQGVIAGRPEGSPGLPTRVPTRFGSRQYSGEGPQRMHTRAYRQGPTAAPPSLHLHPTRDGPLTSLALDHGSGMTSRRPRSPITRATTTRTHRRVPPQQRDQENSVDGETSLMRREAAAVNSRYGEDEQRDVMDETPPRIGRVERRMLD